MKLYHLFAFTAFLTSLASAQGPLIPPGAPAPTQKSLQEIYDKIDDVPADARTAITTLPFTINQAGSYYLTGNLSSAGDGITITTSNVTLNLNGFTLSGSNMSSAFEGIHLQGNAANPIENITVRNGHIDGFGNSLELSFANNCVIRDLHCRNSAEDSISVSGDTTTPCSGNAIHSCSIRGSGGRGLYAHFANSNSIHKTIISESSSIGIYLLVSSGNEVCGCSVSQSSSVGIRLSNSSHNSIRECRVYDCSATDGITLIASGGGECRNNHIHKNIISDIQSSLSFAFGIHLDGSGVQGNRIEGNQISEVSSAGTFNRAVSAASASANLIVKNLASGFSGSAYTIAAGNSSGPIITTTGTLSTTNPWANFDL